MKKRSIPRLSMLVVAAAIFVFAFAACAGGETAEYPIVLSESLIDEGRAVYDANCAACHGDATTPPPLPAAPPQTVNGHTWEHPDRQLVELVLNGATVLQTMPRFKDSLSESQVRAAIAYIKTFWPPEVVERQTELSAGYEKQAGR